MSFFSDAGDYALGGGSSSDYSVPGLSGIFSGAPEKKKKSRKDRYRDAVDAASKFKDTTDYKARREAKEQEAAATKAEEEKRTAELKVKELEAAPRRAEKGREASCREEG